MVASGEIVDEIGDKSINDIQSSEAGPALASVKTLQLHLIKIRRGTGTSIGRVVYNFSIYAAPA